MKKLQEETKDILATLAGIGGGMLLAADLLNPRLTKVVASIALILIALLLTGTSRILKKRGLAGKKVTI